MPKHRITELFTLRRQQQAARAPFWLGHFALLIPTQTIARILPALVFAAQSPGLASD
jgi:hypothetical protein